MTSPTERGFNNKVPNDSFREDQRLEANTERETAEASYEARVQLRFSRAKDSPSSVVQYDSHRGATPLLPHLHHHHYRFQSVDTTTTHDRPTDPVARTLNAIGESELPLGYRCENPKK